MIGSRLLIEFDLLRKSTKEKSNKKDLALLVLCSLGALATHLLSYVNQNLLCWHSLIGMTIYMVKVCSSALVVSYIRSLHLNYKLSTTLILDDRKKSFS